MKKKIVLIWSFVLFSIPLLAGYSPYLRLKFGHFQTSVSAGNSVTDQNLATMLTLQPTVLWDFNSLSSRIGVHYLGDFNSEYGLIPISGVGMSVYFYPYGISTANEVTDDSVIFQKHKVGPYLFGGITPVNFNFNKTDEQNPQADVSFSAMIIELMLGIGVDYPLRPNSVLSASLNYRFGSASDN